MAMPPQLMAALQRKGGNGPTAMQAAAAQKLAGKSEPANKGRFAPKKKKAAMVADTDKDGM